MTSRLNFYDLFVKLNNLFKIEEKKICKNVRILLFLCIDFFPNWFITFLLRELIKLIHYFDVFHRYKNVF